MEKLTADKMKLAIKRLDELLLSLEQPLIDFIVGGGGAMVLAHGFPLGTADIDALPKGIELTALEPFIHRIAEEQGLPKDWLNPYFSTFSYTLPADYGSRLVEVFKGERIRLLALGKEDLLVMKCFAHRQKDVGHAKMLIKKGADLKLVEGQIDKLEAKGIKGTKEAMEFLDDILEQLESV